MVVMTLAPKLSTAKNSYFLDFLNCMYFEFEMLELIKGLK